MKATLDYKPQKENLSDRRLRNWVTELHKKGTPIDQICKITFSAEYRVRMIIDYPKKQYTEPVKPTNIIEPNKLNSREKFIRNHEKELFQAFKDEKEGKIKPSKVNSMIFTYSTFLIDR